MSTQHETYEEQRTPIIKFNEVGDFVIGTLLDYRKSKNTDKYGKFNHIYTLKAHQGKFLDSKKNEKTGKFVLDKEPTVLKAGEDIVFMTSKDMLYGAMKAVKLGQKVKIIFDSIKPTTLGNDAKIIKVMPGKDKDGQPLMDSEWVANQNKVAEVNYGEQGEEVSY